MNSVNLDDSPECAGGGQSTPTYRTVAQLAARHPAFSQPAIRNLLHRATPRHTSRGELPGNGLLEAGAVVRLGRRVLLNEARFLEWVARGGGAR